jgi:hypothetical protein
VGPVAAGALRDATGSFTVVFATLTVLGVLTLAAESPPPRVDHRHRAVAATCVNGAPPGHGDLHHDHRAPAVAATCVNGAPPGHGDLPMITVHTGRRRDLRERRPSRAR